MRIDKDGSVFKDYFQGSVFMGRVADGKFVACAAVYTADDLRFLADRLAPACGQAEAPLLGDDQP